LAREPAVDQWEAGELYPSWWQLRALADLTGMWPVWFTDNTTKPLLADQTSLWLHMTAAERRRAEKAPPPVMTYPRHVLDARPPVPVEMPDPAGAPTGPPPMAEQLGLFGR
jgi:hypothetical protein